MKSFYLFSVILFFCSVSFAQELQGKVLDSKTQEPISGASVYIDGTSQGVITDLDGVFKFNYPDNVNSALVIRMLGYQTLRFKNPQEADLSIIKLIQKADELDPVIINPDPWSRKKKERYFKEYFLGTSRFSSDCKILNLDQVRLRFNPSTGLLTAKCKVPIQIKNKYLGYLITYDLLDFELEFEKQILKAGPGIILPNNAETQESYHLKEAYYLGSSFFQELSDKESKLKKYKKRRAALYEVSELRFFRILAQNKLKESGYSLYYNKFPVKIKDHVRVRQLKDFSIVNFRNEKYPIIDAHKNRSDIYLTGDAIIIDEYGNNHTGRSIKFNGFLASLKVGGMLPLDYKHAEK
ncbi:MAG: carboxypeptidase-like regulatory domain-containing protein [Nonlabens sp.]|uniref:carboxypeptidase-like regulatory domain-containing protein n=1 Tax=Nonlabens sp. TaxID=1888209 RepID=UPI003EF6924A